MSVPCPAVFYARLDSAKFSETHLEDPALDFQTEGGWLMTRARYTRRPPVTYSLGFTDLSNAEKEQIEALYEATRGSSDYITDWIHPISGLPIDVRFKKGSVPQYKYRGFGGNHRWDVTSIEIEEV
ncbi:MAG: hypothetical protein LPK02_07630 [Rhodobacterales bacterium]|nr:hypothetical protein [Rhodobacterales bacterium]